MTFFNAIPFNRFHISFVETLKLRKSQSRNSFVLGTGVNIALRFSETIESVGVRVLLPLLPLLPLLLIVLVFRT